MTRALLLQVQPTITATTISGTTTTATSASWRWDSPTPYIFGGLGVFVALVVVALMIIVCSNRKQPSNSTIEVILKPAKSVGREPSVVVIMAGESEPTYLATPVSI
ncbi:hypothetical protein Droror1_Dr00024381 [Drosera rotundifolia]